MVPDVKSGTIEGSLSITRAIIGYARDNGFGTIVTGTVSRFESGAIIVNFAQHHHRAFHEIEHIEWPFMILFFVLAGASLRVDTLLIAGSSFPYIEFYPAPGQARCVQIDIDATRIGLRYPAEVGLVGDVATTLDALQPLLRRNEDRSFLEKAQQGMQQWNELMETRGTLPDTPMKPQVVAWELGKRLADDAVFTCDSGTIATSIGYSNFFMLTALMGIPVLLLIWLVRDLK